MLNKDKWDKIEKRYLEYWNKENHESPLICAYSPKDGHVAKTISAPNTVQDKWLDTEYVIKAARENMSATYFGGDAIPTFNPNLGPDIFGAILGCELEFGQDTSWSIHNLHDWNNVPEFKFDPENKWWKKIVEITEAAVEDSKGEYLVGVTDLHAGMDGLVSLRGPAELCMDLYDNPQPVKKAVFEHLEIFKEVYNKLFDMTQKYQTGTTNWMGVWHPQKWYVSSTDFICMISQDMFDEFVLEELKAELDFFDASIFHLDGPGALKHLDALLQLPRLNGVQWVYGAGQPTAKHWIPTLKKIQDAGKLIHLHIFPEDLDTLLENIKPEGVMYNVWCGSEDEANAIIKKTENAWKYFK